MDTTFNLYCFSDQLQDNVFGKWRFVIILCTNSLKTDSVWKARTCIYPIPFAKFILCDIKPFWSVIFPEYKQDYSNQHSYEILSVKGIFPVTISTVIFLSHSTVARLHWIHSENTLYSQKSSLSCPCQFKELLAKRIKYFTIHFGEICLVWDE